MDWLNEYQSSIENPTTFWKEQASRLDWFSPFNSIFSGSFETHDIKWFEEGTLNVSYNCIDRHLEKNANKTAILWQGDNPQDQRSFTYQELYQEVCQFSHILKSLGVNKGNRVCIYMPMIPEAAFAMLACTRIGAIHSVVFAGFSPESIKQRIIDCDCEYVITADGTYRAGKLLALKDKVDQAIKDYRNIKKVLVIQHANNETSWNESLDCDYHKLKHAVSTDFPAEAMNAEDPLFILYTSGSTGKPKGVLHTTAGYLLYASLTHEKIFDLKEDDIYWCTADVGWITGHSYVIYGPLANGTTTLMFEGAPTYPDKSRWFEIIDQYRVSIFYTAPTAIRAFMAQGEQDVLGNTLRDSLRILGTVGEPINPEAWQWYYEHIGNSQCPIVDTWWQTETGGIMISPCSDYPQKPGAAMTPFLGIEAVILDKNTGKEVSGSMEAHDYGALAIKSPWPGMMRTVYGDHQRFVETYLKPYPGYYFPQDGAWRDKDNDIWITGRLDDVISIAGHRLGTAEIESALVAHQNIAEAAIIGIPDQLKGQTIYAYVTVTEGTDTKNGFEDELRLWVRNTYGPIAIISHIQFTQDLPKTRSGKIMRRILRKIAHFEENHLGDITTLADSHCIQQLIDNRIDYR
ncbi:acetate--CoA ligase [Thiotrichales bacterium 19S9-12]|nr:acetate--CoA ligase [Thiotrichales bacterium 19S9-11]MCF6812317.1 acetate--CoA ligase [Thiotrichales bacterium 19S9-12]